MKVSGTVRYFPNIICDEADFHIKGLVNRL